MGILARWGIVLLAAVASITTACTAAPSVVNGCPEADYKPLFELSGRKYQASFRDRIGELSGGSRIVGGHQGPACQKYPVLAA
jgi:hypothetical protein